MFYFCTPGYFYHLETVNKSKIQSSNILVSIFPYLLMREINLLLSFNIFISKDYTGLIELGIPLLDTLCKVSAYIFDWVQSKPSRLRVSFGGKAFVSCLSLFLRPKMIHIFMILRHFEKTALPAPTPDLCFQDFSALCVLSISWVKLFVLLISLLYCCVCTFFVIVI